MEQRKAATKLAARSQLCGTPPTGAHAAPNHQSHRRFVRSGIGAAMQCRANMRRDAQDHPDTAVEVDMRVPGPWARIALGVSTVLAGAACSDVPAPSAPAVRASMGGFAIAQDATPDQMAVAEAVPGFGGYFLDATGAPTVYLIDASRRADAEQALAGFLADRGFAAADLRVRQG